MASARVCQATRLFRVDRGEIGTGAVWERIGDNWFLWIVWFVLAALGIGSQVRSVAATRLPADRWTRAQLA